MPEVKSPFLNDEKQIEHNKEGEIKDVHEQRFGSATGVGENVFHEAHNDNMKEIPHVDANNEKNESLEIQKESKLLRNIIITMIVLLVIALMGLLLYNLLNKAGGPADTESAQFKTSVEVNDFDMKSEKFRARSIIIE